MQDLPPYLPVFSVAGHPAGTVRRFHQLVTPRLAGRGLLTARVCLGCAGATDLAEGMLFANGMQDDGSLLYSWQGDGACLVFGLRRLAAQVDLILVEAEGDIRLPRLLLEGEAAEVGADALDLRDFAEKPEAASERLVARLRHQLALRPVWACILIGGRSSRMGRPKHLLPDATGTTWLERTVRTVRPLVAGVVLSGGGEVPASLAVLPRLPDIPGVAGPLTGILSAMRWQPDVVWLLLACDMPAVSRDAVAWLVSQGRPGRWGTLPRIAPERAVEPLFARYEPQAAMLFERLNAQGVRRISRIAEAGRIEVVPIPPHLASGWENINTPEELHRFNESSPDA